MKQKPHEWTPLHILPNAKCRQLFEANRMALWDYDIAGEESEPRAARLADGVDVCLSCTEVDDCHRWAMDNEPVVSGVWGGQIFVPIKNQVDS